MDLWTLNSKQADNIRCCAGVTAVSLAVATPVSPYFQRNSVERTVFWWWLWIWAILPHTTDFKTDMDPFKYGQGVSQKIWAAVLASLITLNAAHEIAKPLAAKDAPPLGHKSPAESVRKPDSNAGTGAHKAS